MRLQFGPPIRRQARGVRQRSTQAVGLAETEVRGRQRGQQPYVKVADGLALLRRISEPPDVLREDLRVRDLEPGVTDRIPQLRDPGLNLEQAHLLQLGRAQTRYTREIIPCRRSRTAAAVRTVDLGHLPTEAERDHHPPVAVMVRAKCRLRTAKAALSASVGLSAFGAVDDRCCGVSECWRSSAAMRRTLPPTAASRHAVTALLPGAAYNTVMPARLRNGVLLMVVALVCVVALAACGSSNSKHAGRPNAFIGFSKCMRAHGVTNFPDPSGHGINIGGTGINPRSPAFRAAQTICFKLLPGGGPQGQKASEQQIQQATATAECMRRHGVNGYPDPIVSQESPTRLNPANYSSIEAGGGLIIAIPKWIDEHSPVFEKASKACNGH